MKFFEKFLNHQVDVSDIQEYIDAWHDATTNETIFEYLGMTEKQYETFIRFPEKAEQFRSNEIASFTTKIESHYTK